MTKQIRLGKASRLTELLGYRALQTLGRTQYLSMLAHMPRSGKRILASRDFTDLDRRMSTSNIQISYRNQRFTLQANELDEILDDGTYTFGLVRELFIRDCYFRLHQPDAFLNIKSAVDIGANRGLVSAALSSVADVVVAVEAQPDRIRAIELAMAGSRSRSIVLNGFAGQSGKLANDNSTEGVPEIDIDTILDETGHERIDFVKLDIEGSEFALFEEPKWLRRVNLLSMEVHPQHGDSSSLRELISSQGFAVKAVDDYFRTSDDPERIAFLFAKNLNPLSPR